MMWKPNSVRTTSEIAPGLRRNATSSNSFTITPRRNHPSTPPCSRDTLSAEYFFATSAKVAPPLFRSATTSDSASCSARTLAAESGFGTTTTWEGDGGRPLGLLLPVRLPERPHLGVRRRNRPQFPLLLESLDQPLLQDRATLLVGEPAAPFLFRHEPGRAKLRLELWD